PRPVAIISSCDTVNDKESNEPQIGPSAPARRFSRRISKLWGVYRRRPSFLQRCLSLRKCSHVSLDTPPVHIRGGRACAAVAVPPVCLKLTRPAMVRADGIGCRPVAARLTLLRSPSGGRITEGPLTPATMAGPSRFGLKGTGSPALVRLR